MEHLSKEHLDEVARLIAIINAPPRAYTYTKRLCQVCDELKGKNSFGASIEHDICNVCVQDQEEYLWRKEGTVTYQRCRGCKLAKNKFTDYYIKTNGITNSLCKVCCN